MHIKDQEMHTSGPKYAITQYPYSYMSYEKIIPFFPEALRLSYNNLTL